MISHACDIKSKNPFRYNILVCLFFCLVFSSTSLNVQAERDFTNLTLASLSTDNSPCRIPVQSRYRSIPELDARIPTTQMRLQLNDPDLVKAQVLLNKGFDKVASLKR